MCVAEPWGTGMRLGARAERLGRVRWEKSSGVKVAPRCMAGSADPPAQQQPEEAHPAAPDFVDAHATQRPPRGGLSRNFVFRIRALRALMLGLYCLSRKEARWTAFILDS